ncbi:MAG: hypothetical protein PHP75_06840 [Methylacidiphilaceae bacterium]|nr:hypothetical protein [Candidatus Methylacidiphilaceae bacterium]
MVAETVAPHIVVTHNNPPLVLPHCAVDTEIEQKIRALAGRTPPQAKDVFDLDFLPMRREKRLEVASELAAGPSETCPRSGTRTLQRMCCRFWIRVPGPDFLPKRHGNGC